ncbi:helix-turn-helix transcriptional regulator [Angustibacter sp. McL0619]|uniref:helix-turn-helix transcriptional regulator n=1 Tax=Angustibacter sp. McL0619 TaxID=3415676 RepID=UPI003CFACEF5
MLVGRKSEQRLLGLLVESARDGTAGTLVIRGEPGVGKSALLDELVSGGGDVTVLRTQGLEVEAPLPFAALHRLLHPVSRLRDGLPEPQARALRVAFGEEDGASVEPFLVGVATLAVLTTAAEESPVLCVVDDAHWLDAASAGALLFCAHRLGADRVALVFAARDDAPGAFNPQGLPALLVTGLDPDASNTLLQARLGAAARTEVLKRIVAETGGNPLALLELPAELTLDQLSGVAPLPSQLHLTSRVEQVFLERSRRLPPTVQTMLLLAAADDSGDPVLVRRAAATLGLVDADVQAAVDSNLIIESATALSVRHPLVRSAVYQAATGAQRRQAHRALADALSGHGDPDREAWHRAAAAEGPDPEVVVALDLAGARAQRRGGHAAALAAYERAAALCDEPAKRSELTFAAARSAWACGQAGRAQGLLSKTREATHDPLLLADVARLRGHIEVNLGSASEAHRIFVEAAQLVYPTDPARALDIGVAAAVMRSFGADSGTPLPVTDALVVPVVGEAPRTLCLRHMLVAMTQVAEGDWHAATSALDRALELGEQVDDRDVLWNLANAALQLGADEAQQHFYGYALARAREAGAVTAVMYCLQRLCFGQYLAGDLVGVRSSAEEVISLGQSIGQRAMTAPPSAWLAVLAALQDRADYDDQLARVDELVGAYPLGILTDPVHDLKRWAKGLRAAGSGDSVGALHHLARFRLPVLARMSAAERIEAAVRAGDLAAARGWTDEMAPFADATGRPWAVATVAFGRALTAEQSEADELFRESLMHHAKASRPLDAARTQLAYGEWLRRSQRRVDARQHLREAFETFQDVRAQSLAARANQELRASGETARKRDPSTLVELTPTELQIARLVSSGLSNKDVAAQCWISPRTVAFHLRNVFTKAGITSRGELAHLDLA